MNRQVSVMRQSIKLAAVLAAVALAILPVPAGPAQGAEEVDFGFTLEAEGAPVAVLLYEPATNIPVDPGQPNLQATFSYSKAELKTGPQSRALASSIWPGAAVGDGFSTLCECEEEWRVRAVAQEPGGEPEAEQQTPNGAGMYARAKGYDVYAEADGGGAPSDQIPVSMGNGSSQSTSTFEKGFAVARTVASAEGVELLGGIIKIDQVITRIEALSNTKGAKATGTTTVSGLTIGGNGYTFGKDGLKPIQDNEEPDESPLPLPPKEIPGAQQLHDELGISFYLEEHESSAQNTTATREAGGLRISIETIKLRERWDEQLVLDLLENLPPQLDEAQAPIYQFLAGAPRIDFVIGRGFVESASTIPYVPPDIPTPDTTPPPPDTTGGSTLPPPSTTSSPPTVSPGSPGVSTVGSTSPSTSFATPTVTSSAARSDVGQPLAAGPVGAATTPAAAQLPALFAGLPPGLVIGALLAALLAARGLARFGGLAMGGGGGPMCSIGSRKSVPNLRDL